MRRSLRLLPVPLLLAVSACTFVHLAPDAARVRVLGAAPAGCLPRGEAKVSVQDRVLYYRRSELQVRDELETLARNAAPGAGADAISPLGPPEDGRQRWALWRCGAGPG
ncbi:DUF4156 domain-containing protein [Thermomonas flagellata]|uniref:DUF4156 domain-containing protein n=1 Tax=Thermomonas flagellata TaxID=2888524 RepID=UPI001F046A2C|nr:DUF4156 domain-containing protein [Thermomonas flagellata]